MPIKEKKPTKKFKYLLHYDFKRQPNKRMNMTTNDQEEIIAGLRLSRIEEPVQALYDQHFEGIVTQVCMNGGDKDDGADIFQEAILVLIEKIRNGQFRGESSLKTFLYAIARNLWLHEMRTKKRRNSREINYVSGDESIQQPDIHGLTKEDNTALETLMQQIGNTCKQILTGFYYDDKSMKELLQEFEYENEQVLRNKKSKCMKKLKELIMTNTNLLYQLKNLSNYEY